MLFAVALLPLVLTGCGSWLGESEDPPLPGERISVLALERALEPDREIADVDVRLPQPYANANWPQAGGVASHAMHHLDLGDSLSVKWRRSIGSGASSDTRLQSAPVVVDGRVFALDTETVASAFDAETGERLWDVNLTPEDEEEGSIGGGVAADYGRVFVSTSYGEALALDAVTGEIIWRTSVGAPIRAAPALGEGRVFVITLDNQLYALSAEDGEIDWTYEAAAETAALLGSASAAVDGGLVVAPFTSGEVIALRVENGRVAWGDQLSRTSRTSSLGMIGDIAGRPVMDRGIVFAVNYSGRLVAIDQRTGNRIWEQEIGSAQSPWVAGDFVYVLTSSNELVCLTRRDGRIRWVRALARFEDEEDREDPIVWVGPVLAGDRIIVASNVGYALSVSPYTGEILGQIELPSSASVAPVVAGKTLYFLTDDAQLTALR